MGETSAVRKKRSEQYLKDIKTAIRRAYPDRNVSSAYLEGIPTHDGLFEFLMSEAESVFDPTTGKTENLAEVIRAFGVVLVDVQKVVKALELLSTQ